MANQKTEWILELKDNMSKKLGIIDSEFDDVKKSHDDLNDQLKKTDTSGLDDLKKSAQGNDVALGGAAESATDFYTALQSGDIAGAAQSFEGLKGSIIGATKAGLAFIATPIGATLAILAGIGLATNEWAKFNQEALEANRLVKAITNANDDQLSDLRVMAMALEKTYGGDWQEHLRQINSLQKGFKISSKEAFDEYNNGMLRGGRANDEFRDSIREYPKLFEKYGFAARDFINIINNSADAGVWSDKMPDAIKEFGLAVTEQTQPARDAMENAFGKDFTDGLFRNVRDGSITVREALKMVSEESTKTSLNQQQQAQLTADLFKGAGEDAGGFSEINKLVGQSLTDQVQPLSAVEQGLSDIADQNYKLEQAQKRALESNSYKILSEEVNSFWKETQIFFYNYIDAWNNMLSQAKTMATSLFGGVKAVVDNFYDLTVGNILSLKNEIVSLVDAALGVGNIWDAISSGDMTGAIDAAKEWKKTVLNELEDVEKQFSGTSLSDTFKKGMSDSLVSSIANDKAAVLNYNYEAEKEKELNKLTGANGGSGGSSALDLGGTSNGGGGRVLNMNLDIKNYFNVGNSKTADVQRMADEIIGIVVDRFRDGAIAIG
jgi:hypothetical protein